MARPKEFDRDDALERALEVFWEKGYEATSIADLVEATGVQRQSLYDTFGDKHGLFEAALDRYTERSSEMFRALEAPSASPLANLRRVLHTIAAEATEDGRGCMVVNAAVERGKGDGAVTACAQRNIESLERAFRTAIVRAQAAGEVPPTTSPKVAAKILVTMMWGLRAMGRAAPDVAWERAVVDGALRLLER